MQTIREKPVGSNTQALEENESPFDSTGRGIEGSRKLLPHRVLDHEPRPILCVDVSAESGKHGPEEKHTVKTSKAFSRKFVLEIIKSLGKVELSLLVGQRRDHFVGSHFATRTI